MKINFYRLFGVLLAVMVLLFAAGSAAGAIGATSGLSQQYAFNGVIDDVRLFSRALSDEEIAALWQADH